MGVGEEGKNFLGGKGSNSQLFYPIRLDMISGRRGCRISNYLHERGKGYSSLQKKLRGKFDQLASSVQGRNTSHNLVSKPSQK